MEDAIRLCNGKFSPVSLPSTPTGHSRWLPLPKPGSAGSFSSVRSFSFPQSPGSCSYWGHLIVGFFLSKEAVTNELTSECRVKDPDSSRL